MIFTAKTSNNFMDSVSPDTLINEIDELLSSTLKTTGASGYVVGLSGGIDSALVASLCAKSIGNVAILPIFMPTSLTHKSDYDDVNLLCEKFGLSVITVPIDEILNEFKNIENFDSTPYLIGNIMARIRMTLLYYYANKNNMMVCGTSNKTEFLIGYSTKYGDNAADVQPIIHLLKKDVRMLSEYIGVPDEIIQKPPSAGLWEGQTDEKEIGYSYDEIDETIIELEQENFFPRTHLQEIILKKIERSAHKRTPAFQVKR